MTITSLHAFHQLSLRSQPHMWSQLLPNIQHVNMSNTNGSFGPYFIYIGAIRKWCRQIGKEEQKFIGGNTKKFFSFSLGSTFYPIDWKLFLFYVVLAVICSKSIAKIKSTELLISTNYHLCKSTIQYFLLIFLFS